MKKKSLLPSILYCLRVVLIILVLVNITSDLFSQKKSSGIVVPVLGPLTFPISCDPVVINSCNLIQNSVFEASVTPHHPDAPINMDQVLPWQSGSGTCALFPGTNCDVPPPTGVDRYVFGGAGTETAAPLMESIVQKIPDMIPGHSYVLSFYLQHKNYFTVFGTDFPLDYFNIHLINCDDYNNTFTPEAYNYPPIPLNSQQIYCQNNVTSNAWERMFVRFVAQPTDPEHPLNMIWIWPQENNVQNRFSGMYVALPELIDVTNFNAGPTPYATPPNCTVTLGPLTPNCYPTGAVFTWYDPQQNQYSTPANTQQIQVNTAIAANVGTWTLKMTLPNVVTTNNSCSQNITEISATVDVLPCGTLPPAWPKVYYTWYPQLSKDNNGNLLTALTATGDLSPNTNHIGVLPPPPNNNIHYTIPYGNLGVTNWTKTGLIPIYVLNSGAIQLGQYGNGAPVPVSYCDGTTGNTISTPTGLLATDRILAETSTGLYITLNGGSIHLKNSSTTLDSKLINPVYGSSIIQSFKFNPSTNRLYLLNELNSFKVYDIDVNNTFQLYSSSPNYTNLWIVQIDNQDRVFAHTFSGLEQYDYFNDQFIPATISGYPGATMFPMWSLNPYTEDRFISYHSIQDKIYAVDLTTMAATNMNATGGFHPESFTYAFIGNHVYIATCLNSTVTFGLQNISPLPNLDQQSGFIAKLSLSDFSSFQVTKNENKERDNSAPFEVLVSPNPITGNSFTLKITETEKQSLGTYSIVMSNRIGRVVLQKNRYLSNSLIDIGNLEKGIYYLEIINKEGERVSKSVIKF